MPTTSYWNVAPETLRGDAEPQPFIAFQYPDFRQASAAGLRHLQAATQAARASFAALSPAQDRDDVAVLTVGAFSRMLELLEWEAGRELEQRSAVPCDS